MVTGLAAALTGDPPTVQAAGELLVFRRIALLFRLVFVQILILSMQALIPSFLLLISYRFCTSIVAVAATVWGAGSVVCRLPHWRSA